jgi:TolB-like protein
MTASNEHVFEFANFRLDPAEKMLLTDGGRVPLTPRVFDTLLLLVERHGRLVEKDEFRRDLWADAFVAEGALTQSISILRKTLGDEASEPKFIVTVPKRGYRFIAPVEEVQVRPQADEAAASHERVRAAGPTAEVSPPVIHSLAVLPLENLTGDPAQEYFVDGVTDEIITRVAQVAGLRVISRTSSMQYKGARKSAMQIGRELGVEALLEGTLERSGQRIRLRAQLIHAPADCHLWAKTYDRKLTDILALESELAQDLAGQVKARVASEQTPAGREGAISLAAFEHYLKGKYFLNRRDGDALEKAAEHFRQAINVEPTYAAGYAGSAHAYFLLAYVSGKYREYVPLARSAAERALRLDSTLSQAHTALAMATTCEYNLPEVEREYQLAVALGPNDATAHQMYACGYLVQMGRFEEANREMAQARMLDPVSRTIATSWASMLLFEGRHDEACGELNKVIEMAPEFPEAYLWRSLVLLFQGKHREALADLERLRRCAKSARTLAIVAYCLGIMGQRSRALAILSELNHQQSHVSALWFAIVYLGLGDKQQALAWLERAYEEHCFELIALNVVPVYDPLRKDPRFCKLVARVGLPA